MKTGIIDVGGGLRGIYAAGVLDYCILNEIRFDCCIGVSAGSANVASYLAGQYQRNYRFFHDYSARKEYMGVGNLLRNGSYINLEYIYGSLSRAYGEDPLNWKKLKRNPGDLFVVASDVESGQVKYFTKADMHQDDYRILMASCCVPAINRPIEIGHHFYIDGGVSAPVPLEKAFQEGCDKVVLILTRPMDTPCESGQDHLIARMLHRHYPVAAKEVETRAKRYNATIKMARHYEKEGKVLILSPDDIAGMRTLNRDKKALDHLYDMGLKHGEKVKQWFKTFE